MGVIFLVVVGGLLGWLAAIIARVESSRGTMLNIAAGIGGAMLAGLVINPIVGGGDLVSGRYSVSALLISLLGSLVVVSAVNFLRRDDFR